MKFKKCIYIALAFFMTFTLTSCGKTSTQSNHIIKYDEITISDFNNMVETAVEKAAQSSVAVVCSNLTSTALGSGTIIGKEAKGNSFKYYGLTNRHVVDFNGKIAKDVKVYYSQSNYIPGKVLVFDKKIDMAIFEFETNLVFNAATIANKDTYTEGSFAIAYGSPYSLDYFGTATLGIISHQNRIVVDELYNSNIPVENVYIQHDATINSGNSGGGLFDVYGNLIGMNTQKLVGDHNDVQGIGFAIPIYEIISKVEYKKYFTNII